MDKVLIFGGRGYIGGYLKNLYPQALTPGTDIADAQAVAAVLDEAKPTIVINAAGKTGRPNVDWCETHKQETIDSNVLGPLNILRECARRSIYWVHIGSGCIYEGDNNGRGFDENDEPNFYGSFYSRTKAWSDRILAEFPVLQVRLRMPFDGTLQPRNLIMKLKKYSRVLDQQNSLTYIPDFLKALEALIQQRETGVFNAVNPGTFSPFEIMTLYKEIVDPSHVFEQLSASQLSDVVATGRSNCLIRSEKIQKASRPFLPVADAVKEALYSLKVVSGK